LIAVARAHGAERSKVTAAKWRPHRADATLRASTILRGNGQRAHLRIGQVRPASRLGQALAAARELGLTTLSRERVVERLFAHALELFPARPDAFEDYLAHVAPAVAAGQPVTLEALAECGLGGCFERATALKLLAQEIPALGKVRLRLGTVSPRRGQDFGPRSSHAWTEFPLAGRELILADPSLGVLAHTTDHSRPHVYRFRELADHAYELDDAIERRFARPKENQP